MRRSHSTPHKMCAGCATMCLVCVTELPACCPSIRPCRSAGRVLEFLGFLQGDLIKPTQLVAPLLLGYSTIICAFLFPVNISTPLLAQVAPLPHAGDPPQPPLNPHPHYPSHSPLIRQTPHHHYQIFQALASQCWHPTHLTSASPSLIPLSEYVRQDSPPLSSHHRSRMGFWELLPGTGAIICGRMRICSLWWPVCAHLDRSEIAQRYEQVASGHACSDGRICDCVRTPPSP